MDDDKQVTKPEIAPEGSNSAGNAPLEKAATAGKQDSSGALSQAATEFSETEKGKKWTGGAPGVAQMDTSLDAPAAHPAATNSRPSSIFDLVNQARQAPAPEVAPMQTTENFNRPQTADARVPSGNWNDSNFLSPLPMLDASMNQATEQQAFQQLANAQAAVDLLTPNNVRIIVNDLEKLQRALPLEMDSTKRAAMQERIATGTRILDSRWECPLRLAFGMLRMGSADGHPPAEAFRLLQEAAQINPALKNDADLRATMEKCSSLYGNMSQAVKQSMEQAVVAGAQVPVQQERSAFQNDPQLAVKLAEQGHKAQLDSPDPYVHARESEVLMKTQGVLSQEAKREHNLAIESAKKVKNSKGESYNLVLGEITKTKGAITEKQAALAKLQEQIAEAKKASKSLASEVMVIEAQRAAEEQKTRSANLWEAGTTIFSRTLKSVTGDAEKEDKVHNAKVAEMVKRGNALRDLETKRKALEGEIKSSQDTLKTQQTKLAEVGKPIAEKHISYAKALIQDAEACTSQAAKALAENNDDEVQKNQARESTDLVEAAKQLNRAEKITPELANNEEIKQLKQNNSIVSSSIGENIKDLTPAQQQDLDDRFLAVVNIYNKKHTKQLEEAMAAGVKPTEVQIQLVKELTGLADYVPELKQDAKLRAAIGQILRGERITEEGLIETAKIESKSLKLQENVFLGEQALQQFQNLFLNKQYKDAAESLKTAMENQKPHVKKLREELGQLTEALGSCTTLEQMSILKQGKQAQEALIAKEESKVLNSIGLLYLTEKIPVQKEDGTKEEIPGPGIKPEQAIQALNQAKIDFPGIEHNPLFEKQMQMAHELGKQVKEMEIKAREDAEKTKEAGIDFATTLTSWGGAAAGGALATAGLVGAGVMVAGAPVTVPIALTILGASALVGAATGGLTKWGLANAFDAKDKDLGNNFSKGAWIGGTTGLGGGGLKVGGMVLSEGLVLAKGGATLYQGVKYADVMSKVSKVAPMNNTVAAILKGANGNVAKEVKLGEEILEAQLKQGKITQETFNTAKSWLSGAGTVKGTAVNTAEILQSAGVNMGDDVLTAAGMRMQAAGEMGGTRAIDAGWEALKAGLPQANNPVYKWNVFGHVANMGRSGVNSVKNLGTLAAYSTPYTMARTAVAGTALAAGTGTYNAYKYGSKAANGEMTTGEAFTATLGNTAVDTTIGLASMGALRAFSANPALVADIKTMGMASVGTGALNWMTRGALGKMGSKVSGSGWAQALSHDNAGIVAPFLRNAVPLGANPFKNVVVASEQSDAESNQVAGVKGDLRNYEREIASEGTAEGQAEKPTENVEESQKQDVAQQAPAPQQAMQPSPVVANVEETRKAPSTDGPPQPITDS